MTRRLRLALVAWLTSGGFVTAHAQDTAASSRDFILEGRLGVTKGLDARSRSLIGPEVAAGVTLAFQLSQRAWGWASVDYMPSILDPRYDDPRIGSPTIGFYSLTAGVSRTFGLPLLRSRWRLFEVGLGAGATQTELSPWVVWTSPPPGAEVENRGALGFRRWRPAAAARLRIAVPIGALRLSGTAGLLATYIGDVPLWNGGWEATGDGSRYRLSTTVWPMGTVISVPLTIGLGFRF